MTTTAQTTTTAAAAPSAPTTAVTQNTHKALVQASARKEKLYMNYFVTPVVWKNALGFLALHLLAVYGAWIMLTRGRVVSWVYMLLFGMMCGVGVTVGAHRLFTHRCFKATWGVRFALILLHTIAGQNCLYVWVRDHRQHHRFSDTDADPHNVKRGFFFSHIGWLMMKKHPAVFEAGKHVDLSDLERDPIVMFQKKYYKTLYFFFAILLPSSIPFLWNERPDVALFGLYFFRTIIVLNITWLVNSAAHMFGTRPFNNKIVPVECEWVAFLSLGEGWHNYHHCFPWDYRAAELGSKHDLSTRVIDWLARRGWVSDLKYASESLVRRRAEALGDGTHPRYGHHHIPEETPVALASVKWAKQEATDAMAGAEQAGAGAGGAVGEARDFVHSLPRKEAAAVSLS